MKKSLVISTIATVLVVVVALTTATFAWFSTTSQTSIESSFTIGATNSPVTLARWLPGAGAASGAYEGPLSVEWALGTAEGANYEFTYVTGSEGIVQTAGGYPADSYMPSAPIAEINPTVFAQESEVPDKDGLPGTEFVTGSTTGGVTTINANNVRPVAVRFQLSASQFASTAVSVSVTISVPADAATADYTAAKNARVYLAGRIQNNGTADENNQTFTVATNYNYVSNKTQYATTLVEFTNTTGAAYTGATAEAMYSNTNTDGIYLSTTETTVTAKIDPSKIDQYAGGSTSAAASAVFKTTAGTFYDCVLYIWLDGTSAVDSSARGAFEVDVQFGGIDATTAQSPTP